MVSACELVGRQGWTERVHGQQDELLDNTSIHWPSEVQTQEVDRGLKSFSVPNTLTHTLFFSVSVAVPLCLFNEAPPSLSEHYLIYACDGDATWNEVLFSRLFILPSQACRRKFGRSKVLCFLFFFFLVRNEPPFRRRACSWPQPDEYSHK